MTARLRVLPIYTDKGPLTHYVVLDNVEHFTRATAEQYQSLAERLAENGGQLLVFAWPVELPEVDVPPLPDNAEREGMVQRWQELTDRWCEAVERSAAEVLRSLREAGMGAEGYR